MLRFLLILSFSLLKSTMSLADAPIPLSLAYPAEGTILNAQVGLIFEKTDILRRHGFQAEVTAMGTGRELKTALVSNQADVIFTTESNFIVLLGNGYDAYAINSMGSAGRMALVVKSESSLKTVADLKGKKIGTIFGTSIHQPALEWAPDAQVLDVGSLAALESALAIGTLDAIMTWDPFLQAGLESYRERVIKQDFFYLITLVSKSFKENKDAVRKLNEAIREALVYYSTHRAEVNAWFASRSRLDSKTIDAATKINENYRASKEKEVSLKYSDSLIERLRVENDFFASHHLIQSPRSHGDLEAHVVRTPE